MKFEVIAMGGCGSGSCPTVYKTDKGTYIVQGFNLPAETLTALTLPKGESAVEITEELVKALIAAKQ